jgi:hypothetical protein
MVTNAPDEATLEAIAIEVAAQIPAWGGGTYTPEQATELSPAAGTSADWEYGELNIFGYIVETCTDFYPSEAELAFALDGNLQGALVLQERVDGPGLRGTIRVNGTPAQGTITIVGLDAPPLNQPRRSHGTLGDYYRILSPGTYDVRFDVPGWEPILVEDVVVAPETYTTLDADFGSSGIGSGEPVADASLAGFRLWPNPLRPGDRLHFRIPVGSDEARLRIIDSQGRRIRDLSAEAAAAAGALSWRPEAPQIPAGIYYAVLQAGGNQATERFVVLGR